jgi:hypothetical protein
VPAVAIENAFRHDLQQAFPFAEYQSLYDIADGLFATVSFPDHAVESRTGGDLGVLLVRPDLRLEQYGTELSVDRNYKRGLLSQAKIFRRDSRWGRLTPTQKRVLRTGLDYSALLLYRYSDQPGGRRRLAPFSWQVTRNATVEMMGEWLTSDNFPELLDSRQMLGDLIADRIGMDDSEIIGAVIAPKMRRSLVIRIGWRDDDGPGSIVQVQNEATVDVHVVQLQ